MTKSNFYIISGGPGGGKTSLLNFLADNGYSYVPDMAREIIRQRLSQGLSPRPDPTTFARELFYKDFDNFISNATTDSLLFFDRSFVDSANLLYNADPDEFNKIKSTHLIHRHNPKVFVTPPWQEIYRTDSERDQTFEQAIMVYNLVCDWYIENQYQTIVIPKDTIENRAKFILDHI